MYGGVEGYQTVGFALGKGKGKGKGMEDVCNIQIKNLARLLAISYKCICSEREINKKLWLVYL